MRGHRVVFFISIDSKRPESLSCEIAVAHLWPINFLSMPKGSRLHKRFIGTYEIITASVK